MLEDLFLLLKILLKKKGYSIIENFLDKKECESIIDAIESFYSTNKEMAWSDQFDSEYRIYLGIRTEHQA